jgi:hypothetical protein
MIPPILAPVFSRRPRRVPRFRPSVEGLEDRSLPSTFTVTDLGDAGVGSGLQGDLRYAITTANANDEASNQIEFAPGLSGTITLTQGPLAIAKDLEIDGPGADHLTVSGNHHSGVFTITADPAAQDVSLSGLTIADGTGVTVNGKNVGGGLYNDHATVTLTDCTVSGNSVGNNGSGGGIENAAAGTLIVTDSTISGNSAGNISFGGGIENQGTLIVNSSTISGNTAGGSGGGGGGGISSGGASTTITASLITDNHVHGMADGGGLSLGAATITDSVVKANTSDHDDGGVVFFGRLATPTVATITDSAIVGNMAVSTGGLDNRYATVTITRTTVSGNVAPGNAFTAGGAGGINSTGRLTIDSSVIADNVGNGIVSLDDLTMSDSTVSGNTTPFIGGGLYNSYGDAQIVNSTFSGNTAEGGGGIAIYGTTSLELTSVTLTGNTANGTPGFLSGGGGLLLRPDQVHSAVVRNTLIAANSSTTAGPDVRGSVISLGYNLVGAADDSTGWRANDGTGSASAPLDPVLGPLQDNGGPTPTHALLVGSPAIRHGDPALQFGLDQRGTVRLHSGVNPPVDIGAFDAGDREGFRLVAPAEVTAGQPFAVTVVALDGAGNTASTYTGTVHFSSTDPEAALPDDYTFAPSDGGMASFLVTLQTEGSQQLQVNDVMLTGFKATATVAVDPATAPGVSAASLADLFTGGADPTGSARPGLVGGRSGVGGVGRSGA